MKRTVMLAGLIWASVLTGTHADEELRPPQTTLEQVKGCPDAYRKIPFELDLLYDGPGDVFNPFYTVFEPQDFMNVRAWGATDRVWTRDGFTNPHYYFYVSRRRTEVVSDIMNLSSRTWIRASCIVRSTFSGDAWIEILDVQNTGTRLTQASLRHLVRGAVHAERGEPLQALVEFEAAELTGMPDHFLARYKADMGRFSLGAGDPERAMEAFRQARRLDGEMKEVAGLFEHARATAAALERGEPAPPFALTNYAVKNSGQTAQKDSDSSAPDESTENDALIDDDRMESVDDTGAMDVADDMTDVTATEPVDTKAMDSAPMSTAPAMDQTSATSTKPSMDATSSSTMTEEAAVEVSPTETEWPTENEPVEVEWPAEDSVDAVEVQWPTEGGADAVEVEWPTEGSTEAVEVDGTTEDSKATETPAPSNDSSKTAAPASSGAPPSSNAAPVSSTPTSGSATSNGANAAPAPATKAPATPAKTEAPATPTGSSSETAKPSSSDDSGAGADQQTSGTPSTDESTEPAPKGDGEAESSDGATGSDGTDQR